MFPIDGSMEPSDLRDRFWPRKGLQKIGHRPPYAERQGINIETLFLYIKKEPYACAHRLIIMKHSLYAKGKFVSILKHTLVPQWMQDSVRAVSFNSRSEVFIAPNVLRALSSSSLTRSRRFSKFLLICLEKLFRCECIQKQLQYFQHLPVNKLQSIRDEASLAKRV
uniref:Uncharacterized protein n=1 Tax=Glossina palpalis gambiensis TaxID=67801 RepID=A0A1B0B6H3_9MUSC